LFSQKKVGWVRTWPEILVLIWGILVLNFLWSIRDLLEWLTRRIARKLNEKGDATLSVKVDRILTWGLILVASGCGVALGLIQLSK